MKAIIQVNITPAIRVAITNYIRFRESEYSDSDDQIWELVERGLLQGNRALSQNKYALVLTSADTAEITFTGRRHSLCDMLKRHWGVTLTDIYAVEVMESTDSARCPLDVWGEV